MAITKGGKSSLAEMQFINLEDCWSPLAHLDQHRAEGGVESVGI